jgi:hypothetical protein
VAADIGQCHSLNDLRQETLMPEFWESTCFRKLGRAGRE